MNQNSSQFIPIDFKVAHTGQRVTFNVPINISMKNFIEFVKNNAYETFDINRNLNIEVVEAGQGGTYLRSEDAPAVESDCNITFRQKYNGNYKNIAFYIRVLT
jgi:hypothetical protein